MHRDIWRGCRKVAELMCFYRLDEFIPRLSGPEWAKREVRTKNERLIYGNSHQFKGAFHVMQFKPASGQSCVTSTKQTPSCGSRKTRKSRSLLYGAGLASDGGSSAFPAKKYSNMLLINSSTIKATREMCCAGLLTTLTIHKHVFFHGLMQEETHKRNKAIKSLSVWMPCNQLTREKFWEPLWVNKLREVA